MKDSFGSCEYSLIQTVSLSGGAIVSNYIRGREVEI